MSKELKEVQNNDDELSDIVELIDDSGRVLKFYHIGTLEHKERWFIFFQPAEEIEGADTDEVVIFELSGEEGKETLLPIEDEALLEEVYEEFCRQMEEDEAAEEAEGCECGQSADEKDCDCQDGCCCGHKHKDKE
jgi:uncharacterized protein YrzB (UPF0473 family)